MDIQIDISRFSPLPSTVRFPGVGQGLLGRDRLVWTGWPVSPGLNPLHPGSPLPLCHIPSTVSHTHSSGRAFVENWLQILSKDGATCTERLARLHLINKRFVEIERSICVVADIPLGARVYIFWRTTAHFIHNLRTAIWIQNEARFHQLLHYDNRFVSADTISSFYEYRNPCCRYWYVSGQATANNRNDCFLPNSWHLSNLSWTFVCGHS